MSIVQLILQLKKYQVSLRLEGEKLLCELPKQSLPTQLKSELIARKEEIKHYLASINATSVLPTISSQQSVLPANIPVDISETTLRIAPVSYAQQRLWVIDQLQQGSSEYNITNAMELIGKFSHRACKASLERIVNRHETLRTLFREIDGELFQCVQAPSPLSWQDIELLEDEREENLSETQPKTDSTIESIIKREATKAFDLSCDQVLRVCVISRGKNKHVLVLTVHHIAADGWSIGLLIEEFLAHYQGLIGHAEHSENGKKPLEIQYCDYAHWQRKCLQGDYLQDGLHYWKNKLKSAPGLHDLPVDFARPAQLEYSGALHTHVINEILTQRLSSLSKAQGTTVFMVLQSVFSILLARFSRERDIVIGTAVANRPIEQIEPLIGFFVNSLVLRSIVNSQSSYIDFLQATKVSIQDAFRYQYIPFELLVDHIKPERSLSHHSLFQIMLILHNTEQQDLTLPELSVTQLKQESVMSKFDITLNIFPQGSKLLCEWEYATELFLPSTIAHLSESFSVLLESIVESPESQLKDLNCLSQISKERLLFLWNKPYSSLPDKLSVLELIEAQAKSQPKAIALVFNDASVNYEVLMHRVYQLTEELLDRGIRQGDLVGVCMERSIEMVIGLLAIMRASAAYVPLDPTYPAARTRYILEDAKMGLVLTQTSLLELIDFAGSNVLCLDQLKKSDRCVRDLSVSIPGSDDLAYIIYTSGSTGHPKGVMIEHRSLLNFFYAMQNQGVLETGTWLAMTSLSFDISVLELICPLAAGSRVVIVPDCDNETRMAYFAESIPDLGISHFQCTPSFAGLLLENPASDHAFTCLQTMLVGGEPMSLDLAHNIKQKTKAGQLFNMYGPTETSIWSSTSIIEADCECITIGRPIINTQFYVLDEDLKLCIPGSVGELYIGGCGLARGYLNQDVLTQERFIVAPEELQSVIERGEKKSPRENRIYHTGDLVRWLPDGQMSFVGRSDRQVKVRGFRIELGEIEFHARQHFAISEAVAAVDRNVEPHRLLLYVLVQKSSSQEIEKYALTNYKKRDVDCHEPGIESTLDSEVRAHLKAHLPSHALPSLIIFLDAIPLTPNGKVDHKALPPPDFHSVNSLAYVAPQNPTQTLLCNVWQEVLGLERVSIVDNFFAIGGDSIRSLKVVSLVCKRGIETTVTQLFSHQTIAELSSIIKSVQAKNEERTQADHLAVMSALEKVVKLSTAQIEILKKPIVQWDHAYRTRLFNAPCDWDQKHLISVMQILCANVKLLRLQIVKNGGAYEILFPTPCEEALIQTIVVDGALPRDEMMDSPVAELYHHYRESCPDFSMLTPREHGNNTETPLLFKCVYFPGQHPKILFFAHSLLVGQNFWFDFEDALNQQIDLMDRTSAAQPDEKIPQKLYPASAMQGGMLYHSMLNPSEYVMQVQFTLKGDLQLDHFRNAWQGVIDQHDVLRTAFIGDAKRLCQLVQGVAVLPWHFDDWSNQDLAAQERMYETYRSEDKATGFSFDHPPLMRVAVFFLGNKRYRVLWTHHHILLDGWSFPLIYRDMMLAYLTNIDSPDIERIASVELGVEPASYEDHVIDFSTRDFEQAKLYWHEALSPLKQPTHLALQQPHHVEYTHQKSVTLLLDEKETANLQQYSRSHHFTLNTLVQLAWAHILACYNNRDTVCFGTTVSGREANLVGIENIVGLFINTIPVVLTFDKGKNVEGDLPLKDLLGALWKSFIHSTKHAHLSLTQIHQQSPLATVENLFDTLLVFENYPLNAGIQANQALQARDAESVLLMEEANLHGKSNYQLTLAVNVDTRLSIEAKYSGADFVDTDIQLLMARFEKVLRYLQKGKLLSSFELMTSEERQLYFPNLPRVDKEYSPKALLHEQFENQAQQHPQRVALICEGDEMTFSMLNERANQVAHGLIAKGAEPDSMIALCANRSLDMVVAILGILKSGSAYLPLEPFTPKDRLIGILENSRVSMMLTQQGLESTLMRVVEATTTRIDILPYIDSDKNGDEGDFWSDFSTENVSVEVTGLKPNHLAYVIYTSGSTGRPKGVMIEHKSLGNLLHNLTKKNGALSNFVPEHQDVPKEMYWGWLASFAFDSSIKGLCLLAAGTCLRILPENLKYDLSALSEFLLREPIDILDCTPALVELWFKNGMSDRLPNLIIGGDDISCRLWRQLVNWQSAEHRVAINAYGPTECCVNVSLALINGETPKIGKALDDVQIAVLSSQGQLCLPGVVGELWVSGAGLARGYVNADSFTNERFVEKTLDNGIKRRFYHTGDLVRMIQDGNLEFVGRADNQVSIRGFRVELGEIGAQIIACDDVQQAIVIVGEEDSEKRLLAYLVLHEFSEHGTPVDSKVILDRIRQKLRMHLPEYMLPAAFVKLNEMPLTPQGKIDTRALPEPDYSQQLNDVYQAPKTLLERMLCDLFSEILKLSKIGTNDDFFALGGDSMQVIILVKLAREKGISLLLKDVIEHRTVELISANIEEQKGDIELFQAPPMHLLEEDFFSRYINHHFEDCYPLTAMQEFMVEYYDSGKFERGVYHPQHVVEIKDSNFSVASLEKALTNLQSKHPILRTDIFYAEDGRLLQGVKRSSDIKIHLIDSKQNDDDAINRLLKEDISSAFTLAEGEALIRFSLLKRNSTRWALLISCHHAIMDGWGFTTFLNELLRQYLVLAHGLEGERIDTFPSATSPNVFKEHVSLSQEASQSDEHYLAWCELLADYEPMPILPLSESPVQGSASIELRLDNGLTGMLNRLAQVRKLNTKILFLHAYQKALGEVFNIKTVTVDVVSNSRSDRLSDPVNAVGLFWNLLPICTYLGSDNDKTLSTLSELLGKADVYAHYPLYNRHINEIIGVIGYSGTPLTYAAFNYTHFHHIQDVKALVPSEVELSVDISCKNDKFHHALKLFISMDKDKRDAEINLDIDRSLISREQADRLLSTFHHHLVAMVEGVHNL